MSKTKKAGLTDEDYLAMERLLGMAGRMLSGSKRTPPGREDHKIFWNACLFAQWGKHEFQQIWFGDLDTTENAAELQELADHIGVTLYATPEQPYRFDGFVEGRAHDYHRADQIVEVKPR